MNPRKETIPSLSELASRPAQFVKTFLELANNDYESAASVIKALKTNPENNLSYFIDIFKSGYFQDPEQQFSPEQLILLESIWESPDANYSYSILNTAYSADEAEQAANAEWKSAVRQEAARQVKPLERENKELKYEIEDLKEELSKAQADLLKINKPDQKKLKQDQAIQSEKIKDLESQIVTLTARSQKKPPQLASQKSQALSALLNDSKLENIKLQKEIQDLKSKNAELADAQKQYRAANKEHYQLLCQLMSHQEAQSQVIEEQSQEVDFYKSEVKDLKEQLAEKKSNLTSSVSLAQELSVVEEAANDNVFTEDEKTNIESSLKKAFGENMIKLKQKSLENNQLDFSCKIRESMGIDHRFPRYHDTSLHFSKNDGKISLTKPKVEGRILSKFNLSLEKFDKTYSSSKLPNQQNPIKNKK